jgi:Leucine-rich repeat (LRR) protein
MALKSFEYSRQLSISGPGINDEVIGVLPRFCNLNEITIFGANISDLSFSQFDKCLNVEVLTMDSINITDHALNQLPGIESLKGFQVANMPFLKGAFLAAIKNLEYIELDGTNITSENMVHFSRMMNLYQVVFRKCNLTGEGFSSFGNLPKLKVLGLYDCKEFRGESLAALGQSTSLISLDLSGSSIGDHDLPFLAQLQSLKMLTFGEGQLSPAAIEQLRGLLPNCTVQVFP